LGLFKHYEYHHPKFCNEYWRRRVRILFWPYEHHHSQFCDKYWKPAFFGCYGLTNIIVANSVPPTIAYNDTFSNESYQDATLYVPKGSLRAYQTAISWSKFLHVEEYDARSIESAQVNNARVTVPIYGLQGQQMKEHREHLSAGIYIQGGKKFIVK